MISKEKAHPSRRDLLKARFLKPAGQIAGLMIQARPEHIKALTPSLNAINGIEVHGTSDKGRMVVTVEAENDQHLLDLISAIERREHVITASLVYHQIED